MAIQSQPSRISEPFAGSGTKNTIPATNATPSASQAASWASGFPPECSQPISAGGCPVPRNDVNGVLNQISQDYAFRQDGGVWEWSALADYDASRVVRGSDGKLYWSVQQSGPSVVAGAQDPTADDGTYWTALPTDDSNVVHKEYSETITGTKSFLSDSQGNTNVVISTPDINIGSDSSLKSTRHFASLQFASEDGVSFGTIEGSAPSQNSELFNIAILNRGVSSYVGQSYNGSCSLALRSYAGDISYIDCTNLMIHSGACRLDFRSQGAAKKGTLPSSNVYYIINFQDNSEGANYAQEKNSYGGILFRVDAGGNTNLWLRVCKNIANSTDHATVCLTEETGGNAAFRPFSNGSITLGASSSRWGQIYSTSSTISTSDGRLKTVPEPIPDAVLDAWGDVGFVQFQMLDSVQKKGGEAARLHSGLIAQRIDEAFKAHGLDASRYGLFCWDSWEAEPADIDEKGNVVAPALEAGDAYSLRYEEALCMEAAYQRRRADRAEARLAALEERLAAIEAKLHA